MSQNFEEDFHNALSCTAIAKGIPCTCHALVFLRVPKQTQGFFHNFLRVSAHELGSAYLKDLRPLRGLTDHKTF